MTEKIRLLNVELALFVKELHTYIENVNEINEETTNLLIEATLAVNKLQIRSKYRETPTTTNDNQFVSNLNDEIFKCRRHIVCCLCHEQIPLNADDFEAHIQKKHHKQKEAELKLSRGNADNTSVSTERPENSNNSASKTGPLPRQKQSKVRTECKASLSGSSEGVNNSINELLNFEQIFSRIKEENSQQHSENRQIFVEHIQDLLVKCIQKAKIDANVSVFGSSQYDFSRSRSDINLFVHAIRNNHKEVFSNLFGCMSSPDMRKSFGNISKVNGNRVLKQQIRMTHTITGINCFILVESDKSILDSCKIIAKFIEHVPMCKSLIEYLRTWQNVLREMHPNKEVIKFQFNTYLFSVLAIFFFQVNYGAPAIEQIWTNPKTFASNHHFMQYVQEFFNFYGNAYDLTNHVISTHVGRWQKMTPKPVRRLSVAQQRLYDGMKKCPASWKNCTMYVHDLVNTDLNLAAEVPRIAAENFQQMCQIFAKQISNQKN